MPYLGQVPEPDIEWWLEPAKLLLALLLAIPIGWERQVSKRNLGLRTFPIVSVGACAFILLARHLVAGEPTVVARALEGLITGMGFIGGGAILKDQGNVRGLSTAASLWCMGAIGASVALDRWSIALAILVINFTTMRLLAPVVEQCEGKPSGQDGGD